MAPADHALAQDSTLDMATDEALKWKNVSRNAIFLAKYLFVSRKSDNFAAESSKIEDYVNVERLLLRLLLLLCREL